MRLPRKLSDQITLEPLGQRDRSGDIRYALKRCRDEGIRRLLLVKGTYHFYPDGCQEDYLFISNNDEGLKRIAFDLQDLDDMIIDGGGSLLIFHGQILPVVVRNSNRIILRDLFIDWNGNFTTELIVKRSVAGVIEVEYQKDAQPVIETGRLQFVGEDGSLLGVDNLLEFDAIRSETAFRCTDKFRIGRKVFATDIGNRTLRLEGACFEATSRVGNLMVAYDLRRPCPAVVFSNSQELHIESVTVHHAWGMGFIAQCCKNVTLQNCHVRPSASRMVSTRADACHFVCCEGNINIYDCSFTYQLDDAGNFHNVYTPIVRRLDERRLLVCLSHHQQRGLNLYRVGDEIELVFRSNLITVAENRLRDVRPLNREFIQLECEESLPPFLDQEWAVAPLRWKANVTIVGTVARANRARGFLLGASGRIRIEECSFHVPGAAILLAGDAISWNEAGPVNDLVVRKNVFDNCNYGIWGRATIEVAPKIDNCAFSESRYHKNILIQENEFYSFHRNLLYAHCAENLTFHDNTFIPNDRYFDSRSIGDFFEVNNCGQVVLNSPKELKSFST